MWWPDHHTQSAADRARYDFVGLQNYDSDHIAELRAANPDIKLFGSNNAQQLSYAETEAAYNWSQNVELRSTSLTWALTQVGSTLTSAINSTTTTVPVAEVSKSGLTLFAVGDVFVINNELFKVSSINGLNLTVKRGTYMGTPAASHSLGARAANIVSSWPGLLDFDVSANCPAADVGYGSEHFIDWNARRLHTELHAADWDGIIIDSSLVSESGFIGGGLGNRPPIRSIDPSRSNTIITDYSAFDAAWNAGHVAYAAAARALVGEDAILLANGYRGGVRALTDLNGSIFENFPTLTTTPEDWRRYVTDPTTSGSPSYLDWCAARSPSYAFIETYEDEGWLDPNPFGTEGWEPDYKKMRYGLGTALMGDGYFSYEMATNGHGRRGLMWFDEYDNAGRGRGYLGSPVGEMRSVIPALTTPDLLGGYGGFASAADLSAWTLYPRTNYAATKTLNGDTAKIQVTSSAGAMNGILLFRPNVDVTAGTGYTLTFRARADRPLTMGAEVSRVSPWTMHMGTDRIPLTTDWHTFEIPLTSLGTDPAAQLTFTMGKTVGTVWLDDVRLQAGDRNVYRRDFQNGISLVNPTDSAVTIPLGGAFRKINGTQDRSVNDGSTVTSVTLQPRDGIILLNVPPTPPTPTATQIPVYRFWNKNGTHFYTASEAEKNNVMARWPNIYSYEGVAYNINTSNPSNSTPLYRLWNANGTHFYTASYQEAQNAVARWPDTFSLEGVAYNVSLNSGNATPVYRFWNVNGTHFYTASEAEKNNVIARWSGTFQYEGIGYYLAQ